MQKINILYVITKLELGGAQKQLLDLISLLDTERYNTFLITARRGLLIPDALSIRCLTVKFSPFLERAINPFKDLLALAEIYRFIKKNKIRIVHTHSSKAGILGRWAARLAKAEIILHTVHGWSFHDYQPRLLKIFFIWLERISARFTDKLIVVSNYDKQKGLDNHIGEESKYLLIRYGINFSEFGVDDRNIRKELGIDNNELVVGMVSCLKHQKSPKDFVKLAYLINQILPDIKFLLVGDGILRQRIKRLIAKFNLQNQVILTGWRRDIPRILSAIDVFVLTSLWEGLPVSILEAMAASLPVVATQTSGIKEVVREGKSGFLVAPRHTEKMAEKLSYLLRDERLRRQIGQNASASLDSDFSLENMGKHTENLYWDLVLKKGASYAH